MFVAGWAGSCFASMAAWLGCSAAGCCTRSVMATSARVAYCFLFTLAMVLAWVMRDFGRPIIERIPWIVKHFTGDVSDAFIGTQAVYRISLGNFTFFTALALILLDVRYRNDMRAKFLMSGDPMIKLGLWVVFNVFPFFLPNNVVVAYGYVARVASAVFLLVQLLFLIDFVMALNDRWVQAGEDDERYYQGMLVVSLGCYIGCLVLVGLLFAWFKPAAAGSCSFNVGVITASIVLWVAFTLLSISPLVPTGSLFPSALFSLYTMYLAFSALQSEPHTDACNGLAQRIDAASGSTLAISVVIMLLSVVYSAFKAGSNTSAFSFSADSDGLAEDSLLERGEGDAPAAMQMDTTVSAADAMDDFPPVSYNYTFFHFVFALASAYIAMLMTGWGSGPEERGMMDIGWASVAIKLITQWTTGILYSWVLVAPVVLSDRVFS